MDVRSNGGSVVDAFRMGDKNSIHASIPVTNFDTVSGEDDDVMQERQRVEEIETGEGNLQVS
jgi:hypothetical protein